MKRLFETKPTLLIGPSLVMATTGIAAAQSGPRDGWYHGPGMMGGSGFGMFFGAFFMILVLIAIVVAILFAIRAMGFMDGGTGGRTSRSDKALDILKERFARGEIDAKEFAERKQHLTD